MLLLLSPIILVRSALQLVYNAVELTAITVCVGFYLEQHALELAAAIHVAPNWSAVQLCGTHLAGIEHCNALWVIYNSAPSCNGRMMRAGQRY